MINVGMLVVILVYPLPRFKPQIINFSNLLAQ